MVKHHSTISRRDFLKILGLGGVGLGTAAISAPVFHDLDELIASPQSENKRPWYVKEVDKPTIEINWDIMKRFDYSEVMWANGLTKAFGPKKVEFIFNMRAANAAKWINDEIPGHTIRDYAIGNCLNWAPLSFLGPRSSPTPEALSVPRWEGTPEENARMMRAMMRAYGASQVGFVELDTNTTEKLIYEYDTGAYGQPQGPKIVFADVDEPSETETERVIPKKCRWAIVYGIRMSSLLFNYAPSHIGQISTYYAYNLKSLFQGQVQNFLRTLGYLGLGEASTYNSLGSHVGLGVMAGMGESSRTMHMITPEYGLHQRVFMLITDLPLAPGKPIDFGAMNFCRTCKKCADYCPVNAIPHDTEPDWQKRGVYQIDGVRTWHRNEPICNAYMQSTAGCSLCMAVCPLSKGNRKAFYHDIMRATVSTTPVLNRFFRGMDDFLGYGIKDNPETFWDLDLPPFAWG
jgi:reductive dehalogenase